MRRALKEVEALPEAQAQALLPPADDGDDSAPDARGLTANCSA